MSTYENDCIICGEEGKTGLWYQCFRCHHRGQRTEILNTQVGANTKQNTVLGDAIIVHNLTIFSYIYDVPSKRRKLQRLKNVKLS